MNAMAIVKAFDAFDDVQGALFALRVHMERENIRRSVTVDFAHHLIKPAAIAELQRFTATLDIVVASLDSSKVCAMLEFEV